MDYFLTVLIGLLAGVLSGLMGIGGGLVIVPALVLIGFTQHKAQGTSLVALLLPVGALAVMNYWKEGKVDLIKGLILGVGLFIGAFAGSKLALSLPSDTMRKVFAVFLAVVSVYLFVKK